MRKTATFGADVLDVAEAISRDPEYHSAAARVSGREVPSSESGRIDLLASIGAAVVRRSATDMGYERLAAWLDADPTPRGTQAKKGRPPVGEDQSDLDALFEALEG